MGTHVKALRCIAHGSEQCRWCTLIRSQNLAGVECRGCVCFADTGMHWDTCPYRIREYEL